MIKTRGFFIYIFMIGGLLCSRAGRADLLVAPRKQTCEQNFKEAYGFLKRGKNPFLDQRACPISYKLLTWLLLLKHKKGTPFQSYEKFIRENPNWPQQSKLREGTENVMNKGVAPEKIVAFFKTRDPVTSIGILHYIKALFSTNQAALAREKIHDFWQNRNFSAANERTFYRRYRKYLTAGDHQKRLDRMALEGNYYGLKRMVPRVSKRAQRIVRAVTALIRMQPVADFCIKRLMGKERFNPGIIYQRIKWRLKKRRKKEARALFLDAVKKGVLGGFPHRWFKYRYYFARMLFEDKHYAEAYALIKDHGLDPSNTKQLTDYAAAEWFSGWVALRYLKKPQQARAHFRRMLKYVKTPISTAKALYWLGRVEVALGHKHNARLWYEKAAQYPHVFYGQEALKHLGKKRVLRLKQAVKKKKFPKSQRELMVALRLLHDTNPHDPHIKPFLIHLSRQCQPGTQENFVEWMHESGLHRWLVLGTKIAGRQGGILLEKAFPTFDLSSKVLSHPHLSKVFLHALIRQESGFDVGIKSPAGACGMMQLMPKTAKSMCKKLKMRFEKKRLTSDANYNIRIGSFFLNRLMKSFDGDKVLALAAYNAGETQVKRWIKAYGDPRSKAVDTLDWVESMPFSETRTYVMRILESMPAYQHRIQR